MIRRISDQNVYYKLARIFTEENGMDAFPRKGDEEASRGK
jgi:hypothetical protein